MKIEEKDKKSGIYCIKNVINGKMYIGSATYIRSRWNLHRKQLKENMHHSKKLQRAWKKYGGKNFLFEILEYCKIDFLVEREQYFLNNILKADEDSRYFEDYGYNILRTANSLLGFKHSDETKKKMSDAKIGYIPWNKGKSGFTVLDDTKRKISSTLKGYVRPSFTKEHRKKLAEANKNRSCDRSAMSKKGNKKRMSNPKFLKHLENLVTMATSAKQKIVWKIDPLTNKVVEQFDSINEAGESINKGARKYIRISSRKKTTYKGFLWKIES